LSSKEDQVKRQVLNRLRRAQGQLGAVIKAVEGDGECQSVVTQLAAVSAAIDRAGFAVIASGMERCLGAPPSDNDKDLSIEELEKLFMMLV